MLGVISILLPIGLAAAIAGLVSRYGKRFSTVGGTLLVVAANAILYACLYVTLQLPEMFLTLPLTLVVMIPWGYAFTNGAATFMPAIAVQALVMSALSAMIYYVFKRMAKRGEPAPSPYYSPGAGSESEEA